MKRDDRERACVEVCCRTLGEVLAEAQRGGPSVEQVIHDTVYEERKRLDRESRSNPRYGLDRGVIERAHKRALSTTGEGHTALLRELIEHFMEEIAGRFDPRVYAIATRAVPTGLALMLNALSPSKLLRSAPALPSLNTNVVIRGEIETLRRLKELGTVILCPTHLSNLDSPVVGWALYEMGLPPFIYGAGINLFTNPVLSYFMQNLGAYRVDRKKTAAIYKKILKTYSTVTLELGYDNLFFPGGTRSRSGAVEPKLKLGLLGCGLSAYIQNLIHKKDKPNVYIVPCTLSYQLVLEAETLIDDYLKEIGKARYVIEDDESSRFKDWVRFLAGLVSMDSRIYLTISSPLDPFGNAVEADGKSYDRRGRPVDIERYVWRDGVPVHDAARDAEYTTELGEGVIEAFRRDNTLQSTHIVAFVVFEMLRRRYPERDLYRLLRTPRDEGALPWGEVCAALERVQARLAELSQESKVRVDPRARAMGPSELLTDGIRCFQTYHTRAAAQRFGDRLYPNDPNLLFYYHNRATGYGLEKHVGATSEAPKPVDLARRPTGEPLVPRPEPTVPKEDRVARPETPVAALAKAVGVSS